MEKEFKISVGLMKIASYQSNLDIFFWKDGNNNECDSSFTIYADSCHDFTTEENINYFIDSFEYVTPVTQEDRNKITDELHNLIYQWSSDINEG